MFCPYMQACQDGGGIDIFGIGSMDSAVMGDVTTPGYNFTMSYSNGTEGKTSHVTYTLDASGGTRFTFNNEVPADTYVSWLSF